MAGMPGLIADIGGTNARFALVDESGIHDEQILKCADYPGLLEAAQAYLNQVKQKPKRACMAIAGPVKGDRFEMTNHVWSFSIDETRKTLGLDQFTLMNDFKALALSLPHLKGADLKQLGRGKAQDRAPMGILGPGTGLGVGSLAWGGDKYVALPGEGGHVTMPARTPREFALFNTLLEMKYHHISAERVCSGKGLENLYMAFRRLDGRDDLPGRNASEISNLGMSGKCNVCRETLDLMITFLGRIAGNLALTLGAHGGIYIAGGVVGHLGAYFENSNFRAEFEDKGRFKDYLAEIPTFVIKHPFPAFVGLRADLLGT